MGGYNLQGMYFIPVPLGKFFSLRFTACVFSAGSALWGQPGSPGTEEFSGLKIISSARAAGLCGSYSALAEGASAVGINPAGLSRESGQYRYTGSLRAHPTGANAGSVSYSRPAGPGAQIAFNASYLDYGTIEGMDEQGNSIGDFNPSSIYPSLTYACGGERWRYGTTLKLATEYLGDFQGAQSALGVGLDAGFQFRPAARNLGFGASVVNVGRKLRGHFQGETDYGAFPASLKAGAFYHPRGLDALAITGEAEIPWHSAPGFAMGLEHRLSSQFDLRAGMHWDVNDMRAVLGWTDFQPKREVYGTAPRAAGGATFRLGRADVDYAAQWWRGLGLAHALTLAWSLGS